MNDSATTSFDLLRPCATLADTVRQMVRHGRPCRVVLGRGLRLTYAPGQRFAVSRAGVTPSPEEIAAVCKAARWSDLAILPSQARPAEHQSLKAVEWPLQRVDL